MTWIRLAIQRAQVLPAPHIVSFELANRLYGFAFEGRGGEVTAYVDRCAHQPVRLGRTAGKRFGIPEKSENVVTLRVLHPESNFKALRKQGLIAADEQPPPVKFMEVSSPSSSLFTVDGQYLMCKSHGAVFDPSSGICVAGPCQGQALVPLETRVMEDGSLHVRLPS